VSNLEDKLRRQRRLEEKRRRDKTRGRARRIHRELPSKALLRLTIRYGTEGGLE
jgi:hypothetical protein